MQKLLTPGEVAAILGVRVQTLAVWRSTKRYDPPYTKVGSRVRYAYEDVTNFIAKSSHSTA
jgi:hypothetical protein